MLDIRKMNRKEIEKQQRERYLKHLSTYQNNIKKIAKKANKEREKYLLSYKDIGCIAGISGDAVSEFLRGRSVPNLVSVSAVIRAIDILKEVQDIDKRKSHS